MPVERLALVTGGNRGLGKELCRQLGKVGFHVLMGSRDVANGMKAAAELRDDVPSIDVIELDLSQPQSISAAVDLIFNRYERLDVLVNNAAVLNDLNQQPSEVSIAALRESFEVNFFGPWQLTAALAPLLKKSGGRVVNMATQVATLRQLADPNSPLRDDICPSYQASKVALNALTVLFAKEFRDAGVTVNSVCPGWVLTDMGREELPDYGNAARPKTPAEAVASLIWLTEAAPDLPSGGFFTGCDAVNW